MEGKQFVIIMRFISSQFNIENKLYLLNSRKEQIKRKVSTEKIHKGILGASANTLIKLTLYAQSVSIGNI